MPKSKEMISTSESGSGSESEEETKSKSKSKAKKEQKKVSSASENSDESEDDSRAKKRSKKIKDDKAAKKAKKDESSKKDSDDLEWDLGGNKKAMVREFKGKWYVDIREVYMDKTGEMKPGKKGIFMNHENWKALYKVADEVNKCIEKKNS